MANLAIKGHATRGKEVIEILEMLGGKNKYLCKGVCADRMYLIHDFSGNIEDILSTYEQLPDYQVYTLERFLERFPYKVGDRVKVCGNNLGIIIGMRWESYCVVYKVKLTKNGYETSKTSENLQPYEEIPTYLNRKVNEQTEKIKEILEPVKEIMEEIKLDIPDGYEFFGIDDDNKIVLTKKQPPYPKTYVECAKYLECFGAAHIDGYKCELLEKLQELIICRDTYWKIAGEQMGLGKPWEPDWLNTEQDKFVLYTHDNVICLNRFVLGHNVLAFPTAEMRDAFLENFKALIELCKELL